MELLILVGKKNRNCKTPQSGKRPSTVQCATRRTVPRTWCGSERNPRGGLGPPLPKASPRPTNLLESLQVCQNGVKGNFDLAADGDHRDNNHGGNRRDHDAVLDGGRAFLFLG